MKKNYPRYTKALIINHGHSEDIFIQSIKNNLRLPIEIYPKYKRKSSIQIDGLKSLFGQKDLQKKLFLSNYPAIHVSKGKLLGFKVFIIMDTDDVSTNNVLDSFLDKSLFNNTWLKEYIVPIYNDPDLDIVLNDLGFEVKKSAKRKSYKKVFPGNRGDYETFNAIKELFKTTKKSNMIVLLNYLDSILKK